MWIKVGSNLINDALVSGVESNTVRPGNKDLDTVTVYLVSTGFLVFSGPEAHAVLDYFSQSAVLLTGQNQDDAAYLDFRNSGGTLSRAAWDARMTRRRAIYEQAGGDKPRGPAYLELQKIERDLMV